MIKDNSTSAQTSDLSVKTMELTNVRSALIKPGLAQGPFLGVLCFFWAYIPCYA